MNQSSLTSDPLRPAYHFLPARNWMNDPNGLIEWGGQIHLFYQYNPRGPMHGQIHWGHAVSGDLAHWTELPVALAPTPGGPDAEGCWSGCAVDDAGVPTFIYTGVHPQTVCVATSDAAGDLLAWNKHPANPVIAGPPGELAAASQGQFRDPYVWRENGQWQMVIGSKLAGQGGVVLRYRSDDLTRWEYQGVLLQGDLTQAEPFEAGAMWECPNFFALGGRHVLIISAQSAQGELLYPAYFAGDFDGERFTPRVQNILVHGSSFYAPQVLRLADDRVVMWGWLKEGRPETAALETGWAGVMSLPIELTLLEDGRVGLAPVEELKALRRDHYHSENIELGPGVSGLLAGLRGDALEIEAVFAPSDEAVFGLALCCTPEGKAQARLVYEAALGRLSVEPGPTFASTVASRERYAAPLRSDANGEVRLQVFLDRSVLEVFANDATCLAARLYPERAGGVGLDLFCHTGRVRLKTLDVWRMAPIYY